VSIVEKLRAAFDANWTTVLVGWNGLGVLSSWPDRWTEYPPLISREEIAAYAEERLSCCSDPAQQNLRVTLVSPELQRQAREEIKDLLERLSKLDAGDPQIELRKWRLILLEEVLASLPKDALSCHDIE
jgi:hypothetical protein